MVGYEGWLLLGLLILLAILAFPIYVLVRLTQLGHEIRELREGLRFPERRRPPEGIAREEPTPTPPTIPGAPTVEERRADLLRDIGGPPSPPQPPAPPIGPAPTSPPAAPPPPPPPPSAPSVPAPATRDLESILGANWLSKVGVAAIGLAAAFFLKYAFDSGWIGPTARVAIGLTAAGVLLGLAQYLLTKPVYRNYAQVLASGGIVILFLSIWAAYGLYHLIGFGTAFGVLAAAALAASAVAVKNDTEAVALLCIAGAFLTPVLIRQEQTASGDLVRLYAYLAGLNVWSTYLVKSRPWYSLTLLSFGATWLLFFGAGRLREQHFLVVEIFAVIFLVLACYSGIGMMRTRDVAEQKQESIASIGVLQILAGCLVFAIASALVLTGLSAVGIPALALIGVFLALLLAGFGVFACTATRQAAVTRDLFGWFAAAALVLLMGIAMLQAPPVKAVEVPAAFGFALFVYLLFLAAAVYVCRTYTAEGVAIALLVANAITHVMVIFHSLDPILIWEIKAALLWLPIAGWITLWAILAGGTRKEAGEGFSTAIILTAQALPLIALFSALALGGDWPAKRGMILFFGEFLLVSSTWLALRRHVRLEGFRGDISAAFGNAAIFFALLALAARMESYQGLVLLCGVAIVMAAYHAVVGGSVLRRPEDDALHRFVYLGLGLTFLTIAIPLQLKASYLTLAWAAESAILIWTGLSIGERRIRWYGVILLAITAAKAFFVDMTAGLETIRLLLNTRMLSGASVIAACYVSAWLLSRRREAISKDERPLVPILAVVASIFTLFFVSLDLWDYVGLKASAVARESARQLSLSVFWSLYALGLMSVGIWKRIRPARLFAMGLLYLSIIKVFIFDLGFLDTPYRIISFLGLGVVLLVVSLLYTRFESRLK
ncbi:MAG: DUF2339 domain-containing protein [Armatimonadetes bacterium]|nr:DUF2339 domain-containing protein [Armatimonadota bacterium]NIM23486.1 DUF2339 domain-containing protein [Armatimonadota bacterium]NIM67352.1 DUF2339 domain-containing protein [Armatimonadota bacterium]NIM75853.1 DUF2339 domain-containing protein [Armatimonadota bacterium]NIN05538.1 DUF2339 domain-containing protein [Armatimonadota bacterium]